MYTQAMDIPDESGKKLAAVSSAQSELEAAFNAQGIGPEVRNLLEEGQRRGWID